MPTKKTPGTKSVDLSSRLALTVTETGQLLGISGASVRALIRSGRLRGIPFGDGKKSRSFIVAVDSLRRFLSGDVAEGSEGAGA